MISNITVTLIVLMTVCHGNAQYVWVNINYKALELNDLRNK